MDRGHTGLRWTSFAHGISGTYEPQVNRLVLTTHPVGHDQSYWYSTRPMSEQVATLVRQAHADHAAVAVSADLGPDLLAPWRHPTLTVVYTDVAPERLAGNLVPAEGRADASIITRWTSDQTLLSPAPPWPAVVDDVPLTDPVQQWWDLLDLGGEDRREAADRLRDAILQRSIPGTR